MARADSAIRLAHPLFQAGDGGSTPTSALDLRIEAVDAAQAARLNKCWHSKLPTIDLPTVKGHAVAFAALHAGVIYAVAIWSDPVAPSQDDRRTIELRRFAIAPDAPRFTASRMLKVMRILIMKRWPELSRAISYQAVGIHNGTIYKASGWRNANYSNYSEWGTRRRRKRAAGFRVAPSTRKPSQIQCDKIRWEVGLNEIEETPMRALKIRKIGLEEDHPELFGGPSQASVKRPYQTGRTPDDSPPPPAGMPRLSRREILVPSWVPPCAQGDYLALANDFLRKHPAATAVEVEKAARAELERRG